MTNVDQLKAARFIASVFNHLAYSAPLPEKDKELSWAQILAMAKIHSVFGLVYSVFEEKLKTELTEEQFALCQKEISNSYAKHIAQKAEFSALAEAFSKNGVYFMPLKGYHIKELYPSSELRTMKDIDVLVFSDTYDKARKILVDMGYKFSRECLVHENFDKPPFIQIELHKILSDTWKNYTFDESIPLDGNKYLRMMKQEDFLAFIVDHALKHHKSGGCGLRAIFDISLVKRYTLKMTDAAVIEAKLKKLNLWDFYNNVVRLENFWFSGQEPDDETLEFELYTVSGGTYGTRVNYVSKKIKHGKYRFFFSRLFPPYSFMKQAFPILKKVPFLLPFFYVWRAVRSIINGNYRRDLNAVKEYKNSEAKQNK